MPRLLRLATALAVLVVPAVVHGDGGLVRVSQTAGPFTVTVFTAPTPLRAGPVDVSVLVQETHGGDVIADADVSVVLRARDDPARQVRATALHEQATNKLLYAALLDLPAAGAWQVEVAVTHAGSTATLAFDVDAAPPLPPWRAYWPYFALPPFAIAIYALHQWLVLRPRRR